MQIPENGRAQYVVQYRGWTCRGEGTLGGEDDDRRGEAARVDLRRVWSRQ